MLAKRFFYVSAGIFLLALAYHLGAQSAVAQPPANPVVAMSGRGTSGLLYAVTANGDVYLQDFRGNPWGLEGNIFSGPTPASQPTWGQVKARYRQLAPAAPENR